MVESSVMTIRITVVRMSKGIYIMLPTQLTITQLSGKSLERKADK